MKQNFSKLFVMALLLFAHCFAILPSVTAKVIENSWETMPFEYYNECEGEWVVGTIRGHLIWIFNEGKLDSIHTNIVGTGVGENSGTTYIARNNYKSDLAGFACGTSAFARANLRLIGRGQTANLDVNILIKYTLDDSCNFSTEFMTDLRCAK